MKALNRKKLEKNILNSIRSDMENKNLSGAAAYVLQDGQDICSIYEGYASLETSAKLNQSSLFRLASMTKPVTATAVLIQAEKGKLSLEDDIAKYLPGFSNMYVGKLDDAGNPVPDYKLDGKITITHLLTHTSGILSAAVGDRQAQAMTGDDRKDLASAVDFYAEKTLLGFAPMQRQAYNGTAAYNILARIVELTADMSFREFVDKNILLPLHMTNTTFSPNESQWANMVTLYNKADGALLPVDMGLHVFGDWPVSCSLGGAGLCGSLEDYVNFAAMLLNDGRTPEGRILKQESVTAMRTPYVPQELMEPGRKESWGLGVRVINSDKGILPNDSFGWSGAYGTHFWIDRRNRIVAVYMKNTIHDGGSGAATARQMEKDVMDAM